MALYTKQQSQNQTKNQRLVNYTLADELKTIGLYVHPKNVESISAVIKSQQQRILLLVKLLA